MHAVAVLIVAVIVLVGTAFAAELRGFATDVDRTKSTLSMKIDKKMVEFECAPGTLTKRVKKNADVTVTYTEEAGKKKATNIKVNGGC